MVGESQLILEGNSRKTTDMVGKCDGKILLSSISNLTSIYIMIKLHLISMVGVVNRWIKMMRKEM